MASRISGVRSRWQQFSYSLLFISISLHISCSKSELFTALVELESLLNTEKEIVNILNEYLEAEEWRLKVIKQYVHGYEKINKEASTNVENYLAHPVNAYLLIKRLTSDWSLVAHHMNLHDAQGFLSKIHQKQVDAKFPEEEDLVGSAIALIRLQNTYKLSASDIARGAFTGVVVRPQLSAGDCFELGRQAYNYQEYHYTVQWMAESLARWYDEDNKTANRITIYEYLGYAYYLEGNVTEALKYTKELLDLDPEHEQGLRNTVYYEWLLQKTIDYESELEELEEDPLDSKDTSKNYKEASISIDVYYEDNPQFVKAEYQRYERLCRNEIRLSHKYESRLRCRFVSNQKPYLHIQPLREEEVYLKPRIVLYHDLLYDWEIHRLRQLAATRLKRATVRDATTNTFVAANYRISKSAWLGDDDDPIINQITQRIAAITGLNVQTAEELQVVNYGIGGHYEPHFDFARPDQETSNSLGTGNRIATLLFYMSDVEAGGATVFPRLGISLWPRKGAAAFWYNLLKNGTGDIRTRHAACPVLAGSKWVSNKWFHEYGQEFIRPCSLTEHE